MRAVLEEAVNNALPTFYGQALEENEVRPLGQPEITDLQVPATDGEDFVFTAEVDKRPEIDLPDFCDIELDRRRGHGRGRGRRAAPHRPARPLRHPQGRRPRRQDGDFVSIDLAAEIDGEDIDEVTGVSYEVGSKNMLDGLDEAARSA